MASNYFGKIYRFTSWGESHGSCIGVVIDGVPAGLEIDFNKIQNDLDSRRPGYSCFTSPRKEADILQILAGVNNNKTTGAPLSFLVKNSNVDSSSYNVSNNLYRPGHADFSYHKKYKNYSQLGGGRASARETIARVIAGSIASMVLEKMSVYVNCYINTLGNISSKIDVSILDCKNFNCIEDWHPDLKVKQQMEALLNELIVSGDSVGGAISFIVQNCPAGWGEPMYDKLSARLAYALMSIPATKAFAFGSGFSSANLFGSEANDQMYVENTAAKFKTNNAGGILAGISTGETISGEIIFKPISSIKREQKTVDFNNKEVAYINDKTARHDPTAVIRALVVVKAMVQCVLLDMALMNKVANLDNILGEL